MYETIINFLKDFLIILVPVFSMIIAQGIKLVIDTAKRKKLDLKNPIRYGGMPSSHSAAVSAAVITVAMIEGISSTFFCLTLLLAILVIRDALGLRMELTNHSIAINKLVKKLPDGEKDSFNKQSERIGHTLAQVTAGVGIGILFGFLFSWIIINL